MTHITSLHASLPHQRALDTPLPQPHHSGRPSSPSILTTACCLEPYVLSSCPYSLVSIHGSLFNKNFAHTTLPHCRIFDSTRRKPTMPPQDFRRGWKRRVSLTSSEIEIRTVHSPPPEELGECSSDETFLYDTGPEENSIFLEGSVNSGSDVQMPGFDFGESDTQWSFLDTVQIVIPPRCQSWTVHTILSGSIATSPNTYLVPSAPAWSALRGVPPECLLHQKLTRGYSMSLALHVTPHKSHGVHVSAHFAPIFGYCTSVPVSCRS